MRTCDKLDTWWESWVATKPSRFGATVAETTGIAATGDYRINLCSYKKAFTWGYQCSNDSGHGPGKLYCPEHAEIVKAYYEGGEE